jgi:hypothetical protein
MTHDDWLVITIGAVIISFFLLARIIRIEKERARVNRMEAEHQRDLEDIRSGRWVEWEAVKKWERDNPEKARRLR